MGGKLSGNRDRKDYGVRLYLDRRLWRRVYKCCYELDLGTILALQLSIVEGQHALGFLEGELYEELRARYSQPAHERTPEKDVGTPTQTAPERPHVPIKAPEPEGLSMEALGRRMAEISRSFKRLSPERQKLWTRIAKEHPLTPGAKEILEQAGQQ